MKIRSTLQGDMTGERDQTDELSQLLNSESTALDTLLSQIEHNIPLGEYRKPTIYFSSGIRGGRVITLNDLLKLAEAKGAIRGCLVALAYIEGVDPLRQAAVEVYNSRLWRESIDPNFNFTRKIKDDEEPPIHDFGRKFFDKG